MRGADIQPLLPGPGHDAAGPVKDGMELIPLGAGVPALAPDPGSLRPFLAGTPIDAKFLGRRSESSRTCHGGQKLLSLGRGMGLLWTLHDSPSRGRGFLR